VYLHAYDDVPEARRGIGNYFGCFNDERPHQALGYCVPSAVYFESIAAANGIKIAA
jgi:putative transposase